jgi:NADH:ubiquinone oxidoreductase subunit F (NADH-binding)
MGSGGIVVMDEATSMVDTARFFVGFTNEESCGKCAPCREGLKHMLMVLDKILAGKATSSDLSLLEELSWVIKKASLCGLGQTAPNPVLSTLKYFKDEYDTFLKGA